MASIPPKPIPTIHLNIASERAPITVGRCSIWMRKNLIVSATINSVGPWCCWSCCGWGNCALLTEDTSCWIRWVTGSKVGTQQTSSCSCLKKETRNKIHQLYSTFCGRCPMKTIRARFEPDGFSRLAFAVELPTTFVSFKISTRHRSHNIPH